MRRNYLLSFMMFLCLPLAAQNTEDSTSVFHKHLKLNELVVTGLTGESKLSQTPTPISVVTVKDLTPRVYSNIIDAIASMPGVSQITTGSGISKPVIRGLGYNRVVVINDGVRQEDNQWGAEHGIEVDASSVHSVEIIKGPASLMYGSDALAGVLIFRPAPIMPIGKMRAEAFAEYHTNDGLFSYSLNYAGNQKGIFWDARFSDKHAHAYKNRYDGYVPDSQFKEWALSTTVGVSRNWGTSRVIFSYYYLHPSIVEGERDPSTGKLKRGNAKIKTYGNTLPLQKMAHYKVVSDNVFNLGEGNLKTVIGWQQNHRREFEDSRSKAELYFLLNTLNYDVRYTTKNFDGWRFTTGVNGMYQTSQNKGEEALIPEYNLIDAGLFLNASKQLGRFSFSGGIRGDIRRVHCKGLEEAGAPRFEDFKKNFSAVTGSLGVVYNVSDNANIRFNVSRGFRAPTISELASNGEHEGTFRYEIGNKNLKPESSLQFDLGGDFSSRHVSGQVAVFASRISNYIFLHRTGNTSSKGRPVYQYNANDATLAGFEVSIDIHPVRRVHFENSFSYVNAVQMHQPKQTKYMPFTPPARWMSNLKYEISHSGELFNNAFVSVGIDCYMRQNHYYMENDTESATPGYCLLNAAVGSDIMIGGKRRASVYFVADNIMDKCYQDHLSRLKYTDTNVVTGRKGVFNMGRNFSIKLLIPII